MSKEFALDHVRKAIEEILTSDHSNLGIDVLDKLYQVKASLAGAIKDEAVEVAEVVESTSDNDCWRDEDQFRDGSESPWNG